MHVKTHLMCHYFVITIIGIAELEILSNIARGDSQGGTQQRCFEIYNQS